MISSVVQNLFLKYPNAILEPIEFPYCIRIGTKLSTSDNGALYSIHPYQFSYITPKSHRFSLPLTKHTVTPDNFHSSHSHFAFSSGTANKTEKTYWMHASYLRNNNTVRYYGAHPYFDTRYAAWHGTRYAQDASIRLFSIIHCLSAHTQYTRRLTWRHNTHAHTLDQCLIL